METALKQKQQTEQREKKGISPPPSLDGHY